MKYEAVIGIEVHAELSSNTKIFCGCKNEFGSEVNTHCCPVCTGMPGTLPVLNEKVVEYAIKAGCATDCSITAHGKQDRKNYFYPDLPKAYQISQFDKPLCKDGYVEITVGGEKKKIRINRIHIEEDAGKLIHDMSYDSSLVDYNRCGIPLIEIVSEPDMYSSEEALAYLDTLKAILQYIGVSDCKMQEGSLRCDVNVSVRPVGQKELGTRTEMKNVNTFSGAVRGIEYEIPRQIAILEEGGIITQETRRWDDVKGESYSLRSKEEAHDYRYFPEPDLMPIVIETAFVEKIRDSLPELPHTKKERYMSEYSLSDYDSSQLVADKALAHFFEEMIKAGATPKVSANWIKGDIARILNEKMIGLDEVAFSPVQVADMIKLIESGLISNTSARKVIEYLFENPKDPKIIVEELGLVQENDEGAISNIVKEIINKNPQSVADFKAGKDRALGFLVGQVMKESKGKANPQTVNKLISDELAKL